MLLQYALIIMRIMPKKLVAEVQLFNSLSSVAIELMDSELMEDVHTPLKIHSEVIESG
jgi:uncharacterized membrane protein YcaP (DUF421 family)